jgi:sortase A
VSSWYNPFIAPRNEGEYPAFLDAVNRCIGFPNRITRERRAVLSARSGAENEGHMNFAPRTRKNILSAATIAVLLFAGGSSARATDRPRPASVNRPSATTTVGMIEIPAVGLATMVLEGSNASTLQLAVGHIPGTALPGPSGNVGLAGHRDTFFRPLRRIKLGDEIRFTTAAGAFKYRVISLRVVLPNAIEVLNATQRPTLTLVTCYPFDFVGTAPQRLIVHAEMVPDSRN